MSKKYEESGVSLEAGYKSVELIKKHVARTKNLGMMSAIGGFGGAFDLSSYNFKNRLRILIRLTIKIQLTNEYYLAICGK